MKTRSSGRGLERRSFKDRAPARRPWALGGVALALVGVLGLMWARPVAEPRTRPVAPVTLPVIYPTARPVSYKALGALVVADARHDPAQAFPHAQTYIIQRGHETRVIVRDGSVAPLRVVPSLTRRPGARQ